MINYTNVMCNTIFFLILWVLMCVKVAMGLGDMSNVLHARDGFLYVFANSRRDYLAMKKGHCLMRTTPDALGDPRSWRAWGGGDEFNITFLNPYLHPIPDPSVHVCQPLAIAFAPHYVGWSTHFQRYIAVGTASLPSNEIGSKHRVGMVFSLSESQDSLVHWTAPTLMRWTDSDPQVNNNRFQK